MENLPPIMQELVLTGYEIRKGPDPTMRGLAMQCGRGTQLYIVTRQQFLDLARDFQQSAEEMQKPS
jgi:hypothetical protein